MFTGKAFSAVLENTKLCINTVIKLTYILLSLPDEKTRILHLHVLCLYLFCRWRCSYQVGLDGIPLPRLTPPHFSACSKPGPGLPRSYVIIFLFCELRSLLVLLILVEF